MKKVFKVGNKVKKWSSVNDIRNKKKLGKALWTIVDIHENVASQSGIILDVEIEECPHCGAHKRKMYGYDSDWFVVIGE